MVPCYLHSSHWKKATCRGGRVPAKRDGTPGGTGVSAKMTCEGRRNDRSVGKKRVVWPRGETNKRRVIKVGAGFAWSQNGAPFDGQVHPTAARPVPCDLICNTLLTFSVTLFDTCGGKLVILYNDQLPDTGGLILIRYVCQLEITNSSRAAYCNYPHL